MSALTVGHGSGQDWDDLVRLWEEMEWPEGSKVEIIEGVITVSPSPANRHNLVTEKVQRLLYSVLPDDWGVFQTLSVAVPSKLGMFIPDLVVIPLAEVEAPGTYVPAGAAELVVEVTSPSNARHDRISKPAAYAAAGVPLYLLIDRWASGGPTITLYGEPRGDVYRVLRACKFGEPIKLPEPFDLDLDTSAFPQD
ncbi:Uma2 family endonuclease [Streptomyces alboniger]|uniref:Uma2 family endonuclease n=1 Tax=Streptomyces alboniger TaxID=132473 RepID=A0A5J6HMU1_STRAD|nr:Uma2 family endonuclease [Streptomyces alboniger]QEV19814.1 Uma2 family endonuclease [Streptomyces alboniger]